MFKMQMICNKGSTLKTTMVLSVTAAMIMLLALTIPSVHAAAVVTADDGTAIISGISGDSLPAVPSAALSANIQARAEIRREESSTNVLNVLRKSEDRVVFEKNNVDGLVIVVATNVSSEVIVTADNVFKRGIEKTDSRVVYLATASRSFSFDANLVAAVGDVHVVVTSQVPLTGFGASARRIVSRMVNTNPVPATANASSSITGPNTIPVSAGALASVGFATA